MNHLRTEFAPVSEAGWKEINDEAKRTLTNFLAARRLVDFDGPLGWDHPAITTGRRVEIPSIAEGVDAPTRIVRPVVELRTEFVLDRSELDAIDRGAEDPDLSPLVDAARRAALAEDRLVFAGSAAANVLGIATDSPHAALSIGDDYANFPGLVASAVAALRAAGVDGPYAVALGPRCYTGVIETTERGGYPLLEHLRLITGGEVVYAPAIDGTVVVSQRGGDFRLAVGQDLSIGYLDHDRSSVTLYLEESLTFTNSTPEAAIALTYR